jgi:hypothetical protein
MIGSVFISLPASCVPEVDVAVSTSGDDAVTSVLDHVADRELYVDPRSLIRLQ